MKEKLRLKTIGGKIILLIVIVMAICVLFSAFIATQIVKDQLKERYEVDKVAASESLSYSLAPVLDLYDYKQVERIITSSLTYENIAYITVFDKGGTLVVSATEQNISSEDLDLEEYEMVSSGTVIGSIEVGFSREYIDEQIRRTTRALIFGLAGFLILVGLALFTLINRSVINPLGAFTKTVREIDSENLSLRVNIHSEDELGVLAGSFNQMAESLEKSHTALKKAHGELQQWSGDLQKSEEKYRTLTENISIGVYRNTPGREGIFIECNPTLVMMLGYENKKGLLSKRVMDIYLNPKDGDETSEELLSEGFISGRELLLLKKDGTTFVASVSATAIKDEKGKVQYYDGIIEDITERKRVEEELRKYREHLEELVRERTAELEQRGQELADTNVHLEEMSRHKSQFLANMSHELRTPLNSIIGYTKLMMDGLEGDINEDQRGDLHTVYTNSKHLLELINGLLDLSRIEAGKTVLTYGTFTISDLIAEVIPTMEQLARAKGLTLTYSVAPGIEHLYADKAKTKQVLINILGNAVKFTKEGSIKLDVAETDSDFTFSVTDTGIGIKEEDLEAIFDSFEQVGPAQIAGYEGTGLGLAISKKFAEMQGGRIWAESKLAKGTTLTFTLPKKKAASP